MLTCIIVNLKLLKDKYIKGVKIREATFSAASKLGFFFLYIFRYYIRVIINKWLKSIEIYIILRFLDNNLLNSLNSKYIL